MKHVDPKTLHDWISDGHELAVIDAREDGEFGADHLFWAVPFGMAHRETRAHALLPRKSVRICVTDDGSRLAPTLATWLEAAGYSDVSVLTGGTKAWKDAGYVIFSGMNVPSKAFGEWVEHHYGTESVDPPELKKWIDSGRKMIVLDSRTQEEFTRMSIPTGIPMPGAELAYRIGDLAPDPDTLVVVNCAGRTRSIMGAESLRRAGIPNKVVALRNGTMGWELAGLRCEHGRPERFVPGTPRTAALALERATAFAAESGVREISPGQLAVFEADKSRTLYVLDARDPSEYRAGHRRGSYSAPGGQLVQGTDNWVGVRGARIVVVDDTGVRARMSAAWLRQMGHKDVFVADNALGTETGSGLAELAPPVLTITVEQLVKREPGTAVVDLARSIDFRAGHIEHAIWGVRGRLAPVVSKLSSAREIVLTSPDGSLARFAFAEVKDMTSAEVLVLDGGTAAWRAAGHPTVANRADPPDDACIDFYLRAYDRNSGVEEAMNAYLTWEIDLVNEIQRDGTIAFGVAASH
ncbi:MAG: rhodanese-like domain-containing protein [Acetobacteraceae bacterium]|jgi:rhodanese-related sulfurtransferase